MTAICPACSTRVDATAAEPGSVLTCPGCHQSFRLSMPAGEELPIAEPDVDPSPSAETASPDAPVDTVDCPICKTPNPAGAKVCTRCGALLRRKQWDKTITIPSNVASAPARRRPLTLLVLFGIVVLLIGGLVWMAGRLFVAVETPSIAYTRMAGMAANGDWGRFYDRLHPRTQQGMAELARGRAEGGMTVKQMFAVKDFGKAFMTIHDLPYADFTIAKEEIDGDRAILTLRLATGSTERILMGKDQGVWKLRVSDVELPEQ